MSEAIHLSNKSVKAASFLGVLFLIVGMGAGFAQTAEEVVQFKKNETGLYKDIFDQNVFYEGTSYLHLDRTYRHLVHKRKRAVDVNLFDEVPDSVFFTNRHSRNALSVEELALGHHENEGPDLNGNLSILSGSFEGLHPHFIVRDSRGDQYKINFDDVDNLELATAAEVIASRFYYALGYNVPQYTVATFPSSKLVPDTGSTIYDDTGFKKPLTAERLETTLVFLPQDEQGHLRASVSKILAGTDTGGFSYLSRRNKDVQDPANHKDRRELRALQVFSAWLNNNDVRESNTLDMFLAENAQGTLKHYLVNFTGALGSADGGAKPPMSGHEHMVDLGETTKAFLTLGLWEKPWQKRWREAGEKVQQSPAVGYFDNRYFDPAKFKIELPHYVFKDLTRADGFWAAKIIKTFSDEDVRAMVKAGGLSKQEDADYITKTLIERRDIIVRYWFEKANPLDQFNLTDNKLVFKDLAVEYGFQTVENTSYLIDVLVKEGKKSKKIKSLESREPSISLESSWLSRGDDVSLFIRTRRGNSKPSSYVLVGVSSKGISSIIHED